MTEKEAKDYVKSVLGAMSDGWIPCPQESLLVVRRFGDTQLMQIGVMTPGAEGSITFGPELVGSLIKVLQALPKADVSKEQSV